MSCFALSKDLSSAGTVETSSSIDAFPASCYPMQLVIDPVDGMPAYLHTLMEVRRAVRQAIDADADFAEQLHEVAKRVL
jgi:hypothetical protein